MVELIWTSVYISDETDKPAQIVLRLFGIIFETLKISHVCAERCTYQDKLEPCLKY